MVRLRLQLEEPAAAIQPAEQPEQIGGPDVDVEREPDTADDPTIITVPPLPDRLARCSLGLATGIDLGGWLRLLVRASLYASSGKLEPAGGICPALVVGLAFPLQGSGRYWGLL